MKNLLNFMQSTVHQINVGTGGVPKNPVEIIRVMRNGLEGDRHNYWGHGGRSKAICLYSVECLAVLKGLGFTVFPGALGENFTTEGIEYHDVCIGDTYKVGEVVQIRITDIREPCGTIRRAYSPDAKRGEGIQAAMWNAEVKKRNPNAEKWGMTGFYAEVLTEGVVHRGDLMKKV